MSAFPQEQPIALVQYDEPLVRRLVEKVTIYEDKFTVEFKSGVTVDVDE
ncbi:MAG: integrase [Clostridiaceae bacterium]|nr:integrase [Clostridiaceae bacterium]